MKTNQTKPIGASMFSVRYWMLNVSSDVEEVAEAQELDEPYELGTVSPS
jgi:hypothetical protein